MELVGAVTKFFSEHGPALVFCWILSTAIFWWMGGFQRAVPRVPQRLRRVIKVGAAQTGRSWQACRHLNSMSK